MTVQLTTSKELSMAQPFDYWCKIGKSTNHLHQLLGIDRLLPNMSANLETATAKTEDDWQTIGKNQIGDSSACLAHMPACAANASDFGQMLAWTYLIDQWGADNRSYLIICDDPWMYRHLSERNHIRANHPPMLWLASIKLIIRGYLARTKVSYTLAHSVLRLRSHRFAFPKRSKTLLVYGHPTSTTSGFDGYFGDLMQQSPKLFRLLHVDCDWKRAINLAQDHRTFSLHSWGSLKSLFILPFKKWRPGKRHKHGPNRWLIRRAAVLEGGSGQAAMIRWQQICQKNWLENTKPEVVMWPWENHAWEREFSLRATENQVKTVGYQHTTVGKQELNYSPNSNLTNLTDVPNLVVTSGQAGYEALLKRGYPTDRVCDGGSLRLPKFTKLDFDPNGPIFVALPFDLTVAEEMVHALKTLNRKNVKENLRFLIKDHPMTPFSFEESKGIEQTQLPLDQQCPLSAVLYSATTVGLEAVLGGLPTFEFKPSNSMAMDIMPEGITVPQITGENIKKILQKKLEPVFIDPKSYFSPPNYNLWHSLLDDRQT